MSFNSWGSCGYVLHLRHRISAARNQSGEVVLDLALPIGFVGFMGFIGFIGFVGFIGFIGFIGCIGFIGFRVMIPATWRCFVRAFTNPSLEDARLRQHLRSR